MSSEMKSFLSKWEGIIKDMPLKPKRKTARKERDVYAKLRRAYEEERGTNLTADEVFDLVRGNDAVWQTCYQDNDAPDGSRKE